MWLQMQQQSRLWLQSRLLQAAASSLRIRSWQWCPMQASLVLQLMRSRCSLCPHAGLQRVE